MILILYGTRPRPSKAAAPANAEVTMAKKVKKAKKAKKARAKK